MGRFERLTDEQAVQIAHEIAEYLIDKDVGMNDAVEVLSTLTMALRLAVKIEEMTILADMEPRT